MNIDQAAIDVALDLNTSNAEVAFSVREAARSGVTIGLASGTWGSAVVTFEKSINKTDWGAFSPAQTMSGVGFIALDTSDCLWVRARVSTVAGGAGSGRVNAVNKG